MIDVMLLKNVSCCFTGIVFSEALADWYPNSKQSSGTVGPTQFLASKLWEPWELVLWFWCDASHKARNTFNVSAALLEKLIFNIYVHNLINNINYILLIRYLFEMMKLEVDELTNVQKYNVIDWYNSFLNPISLKCRRLCIHVWGCNSHKDDAT